MRFLFRLIFLFAALFLPAAIVIGESEPQAPLYLIHENSRWGLIDSSGKIVLEPRFENIAGNPAGFGFLHLPPTVAAELAVTSADPVRDLVIPVRIDGKAGFATREGKLLALGRYEEIFPYFDEGRIKVKVGGRFGFADERGELVIPAQFDQAYPFRRGFAFVQAGKKWGIIDRTGKSVVSPAWDHVDEQSKTNEWIEVRVGNRAGVVDRSGREILPIRFEEIVNPTPPLVSVIDAGRAVYVRPGGEVAFEVKCPKGFFRKSKVRGYPYFGTKHAVVRCGDIGEENEGLIDDRSGKTVYSMRFKGHVFPFFK